MDFRLTEQQQHWHDATLRFAREELAGERVPGPYGFWREGYERCARFGLTGLPVPEEWRRWDTAVTTTA
jgi:alkylation response protein AidB-like acyl-CoA dehydrogenase